MPRRNSRGGFQPGGGCFTIPTADEEGFESDITNHDISKRGTKLYCACTDLSHSYNDCNNYYSYVIIMVSLQDRLKWL